MYIERRGLEARADNQAYGGLGPLLLGVSWAECLLAMILVVLRAYGARYRAGKLRWDFVFVAIGTFLGCVTQVLFVLACLNGMGRHVKDISYPQLFATLMYSWIGVVIGLVATTIAKLGIIALLLQVATPTQKKRKFFLWAVGVFICVVGIAQMIITLTQCSPHDKLWYRTKPGHCDRTHFAAQFGYFQGATAIAADFILAIYPVTIVWNLQASFRIKLGFCALMAGGILPAAAAIIRTYYIKRLENPNDFTWEFVPFLSWACTELWFVIILGSIPPLRPLFKRWFGKVKSNLSQSGGPSRSTRTGTKNGTNRGTYPLQSVTQAGSKNQFSAHVMTNMDGSEENILQPTFKEQGETIVMSKEYTVEVDRQ
ncbi:hypothetical protein CAC42_3005 [Sphaceloma murrayae]|uniref:Rhodopsin domain-containing protein n=1 Tax=Sphaceloma murrayae TaxID=2082308 RepID=A0A2K1QRQ1_9PEZI|nr:hypothetical protein CAC42_3005 [Sphaceloma murrayae]